MVDLQRLGERFHIERRRQKKTLRVLHGESGVNYQLISLIEQGKRPQPTLDVVARLADALGMSLDYLAGMNKETK